MPRKSQLLKMLFSIFTSTEFQRPIKFRSKFVNLFLLKSSVCRLFRFEKAFFSINSIRLLLKFNDVTVAYLKINHFQLLQFRIQ